MMLTEIQTFRFYYFFFCEKKPPNVFVCHSIISSNSVIIFFQAEIYVCVKIKINNIREQHFIIDNFQEEEKKRVKVKKNDRLNDKFVCMVYICYIKLLQHHLHVMHHHHPHNHRKFSVFYNNINKFIIRMAKRKSQDKKKNK